MSSNPTCPACGKQTLTRQKGRAWVRQPNGTYRHA